MGNLDSVESRSNLNLKNQKLHYVDRLHSSLIGNFTIYKVGQKDQYIMAKIIKFKDFDYEFRSGLNHPNLLKTLGYDVGLKDLIGAGLENNNLYFEIEGVPLDSILNKRFQTRQYFPEGEIIKLIRGIISALALLQEVGACHGDINSQTIFYDPKGQQFKIYDHELLAGRNSQFQQLLKKQPNGYNVPEHILVVTENNNSFSTNQNKSDIFSLGMVILEMASLQKSSDCYDPKTGKIFLRKIDQRLNFIRQIYSVNLNSIIESMLQIDPAFRPDAITLNNQINSQKTIIINTKKLEQDQLPQNLQNYGLGSGMEVFKSKTIKEQNSTILQKTLKPIGIHQSQVMQSNIYPANLVSSVNPNNGNIKYPQKIISTQKPVLSKNFYQSFTQNQVSGVRTLVQNNQTHHKLTQSLLVDKKIK